MDGVVDSDLVGSASYWWIRISILGLPIWIRNSETYDVDEKEKR
jgi:hypothetical protein